MSGEGPESVPTSADPRSHRPTKKRALTPTSAQAASVDALFAKPDQHIRLPPPAGAGGGRSTRPPPPEIVTNVQGSSAGAGSGEFHVYKAARRREYERLREMDEEARREREQREFERAREESMRRDDEKTRRNREKRDKMKARKAKKAKGRGAGPGGDDGTAKATTTTTAAASAAPPAGATGRHDDDDDDDGHKSVAEPAPPEEEPARTGGHGNKDSRTEDPPLRETNANGGGFGASPVPAGLIIHDDD